MVRLQKITTQLAGKTIQVIYEDPDLQDLLDEGVQLVHDYRWY
jgi:transcription antitermination factor NusA-like protein